MKTKRVVDPEHRERVRAMPCIACIKDGITQDSPTEGHHIRRKPDGSTYGRGQKAGDHEMIPLCRDRHHWNGAAAPMGHKQFEAKYGNELELLAVTNAWLFNHDAIIVTPMAESTFVALCDAVGIRSYKVGGQND